MNQQALDLAREKARPGDVAFGLDQPEAEVAQFRGFLALAHREAGERHGFGMPGVGDRFEFRTEEADGVESRASAEKLQRLEPRLGRAEDPQFARQGHERERHLGRRGVEGAEQADFLGRQGAQVAVARHPDAGAAQRLELTSDIGIGGAEQGRQVVEAGRVVPKCKLLQFRVVADFELGELRELLPAQGFRALRGVFFQLRRVDPVPREVLQHEVELGGVFGAPGEGGKARETVRVLLDQAGQDEAGAEARQILVLVPPDRPEQSRREAVEGQDLGHHQALEIEFREIAPLGFRLPALRHQKVGRTLRRRPLQGGQVGEAGVQ